MQNTVQHVEIANMPTAQHCSAEKKSKRAYRINTPSQPTLARTFAYSNQQDDQRRGQKVKHVRAVRGDYVVIRCATCCTLYGTWGMWNKRTRHVCVILFERIFGIKIATCKVSGYLVCVYKCEVFMLTRCVKRLFMFIKNIKIRKPI